MGGVHCSVFGRGGWIEYSLFIAIQIHGIMLGPANSWGLSWAGHRRVRASQEDQDKQQYLKHNGREERKKKAKWRCGQKRARRKLSCRCAFFVRWNFLIRHKHSTIQSGFLQARQDKTGLDEDPPMLFAKMCICPATGRMLPSGTQRWTRHLRSALLI